ncbi:MAG TPA: hypothetical protein VJB16_04320, partial [archaeon]|nr:hypothetical protein [archaeon]
MNKPLPLSLSLLILSAFALLAAPALAADLSCAYRSAGCSSGETELLGLSSSSDAHAELPGQTSYNSAICCSGATLSVSTPAPPATGSAACATGSVPVLWLSSQTDAHVEQAGGTNTYRYPLCLDTSPYYSFVLSYPTTTPTSPAACAGSLSAASDAHAGDCPAYPSAGSGAKLSLTAREDTTPPSGGSVSYPNGYLTAMSATVTVSEGSDPETGIASRQLHSKAADLRDGSCGAYAAWTAVGVQQAGTTSVPVALATGKCYQFKYTVRNAIGLLAEYTSPNELKVDATPPLAGSLSLPGLPAGGYTTATSLALAVTEGQDPESGTDANKIEQNQTNLSPLGCSGFQSWTSAANPIPLATDTCSTFRLRTANRAGLSALSAETQVLRADSTPPASRDSGDPGTLYGQSYTLSILCHDSGSGCASYRLCEYQSGTAPCDLGAAAPFTDSSSAAQSVGDRSATKPLVCPSGSTCSTIVRYSSTDAAGNPEPVRESPAIQQDPNLPTCTLSLPARSYSRTASPTLSWTGSHPLAASGRSIASYRITATPVVPGSAPTVTQSFTTTSGSLALADGVTYQLKCEPIDDASPPVTGSSTSSPELEVDATPPIPSVSIAPNATGQSRWTNGSFTVRWSGSDSGSGIAGYLVESATAPANQQATSFTSWATAATAGSKAQPAATNQNYSYRATATDAAGNSRASEAAWIATDLSPPACALPPLPAVTGSPGSLTLKPTASDALSGLASVAVEHTTDNTTWQSAAADSSGEVTLSFPDGSQPVLRCVAFDSAGNRFVSPNASTQIDTTGPTFNATLPAAAALGDTVTIRVEATDSSGIRTFTLSNSTATLATLAAPAAR